MSFTFFSVFTSCRATVAAAGQHAATCRAAAGLHTALSVANRDCGDVRYGKEGARKLDGLDNVDVVIAARGGQDLSCYGLRHSHLAFL